MYAPLIYVSASLLHIIATLIIGAEFGFHTWTRVWPNKNAAFRDQPYRTRKIISALHCGCVLLWKWTALCPQKLRIVFQNVRAGGNSLPSVYRAGKYQQIHTTQHGQVFHIKPCLWRNLWMLVVFFHFKPITDVSWHWNTAPRAQRV